MKKYIFIKDAITVMAKLLGSKRVEGVLYIDENTGRLTFKADRQSKTRHKDVLMKKLPWGWLKASLKCYKHYSSVPNDLTIGEQLAIIDQENELVKQALIENYILESD